MQIRVLGPIEVEDDGRQVEIPTHQAARVLTMLAAWPGQVLESERIMYALWGSAIRSGTRNTLQAHVSQLRKVLGAERITSEAGGYRLLVEPAQIDAYAIFSGLERAGAALRAQRYAWARDEYNLILAAFRGRPYSGLMDEELIARGQELLEILWQCEEEQLACSIELSRDEWELGAQIAHARNLVHRHPERERRRALLVRALACADRTGESTAAYHDAKVFLSETVGLDPGTGLMSVYEQALRRDPLLAPAVRSRVCNRALPAHRHTLGPTTTQVIASARRQLADQSPVRVWVRISGDHLTALANEAAGELLGDFTIGVHVHDADHDELQVDACQSPECLLVIVGTSDAVHECFRACTERPLTAPSVLAITTLQAPTHGRVHVIEEGE